MKTVTLFWLGGGRTVLELDEGMVMSLEISLASDRKSSPFVKVWTTHEDIWVNKNLLAHMHVQ